MKIGEKTGRAIIGGLLALAMIAVLVGILTAPRAPAADAISIPYHGPARVAAVEANMATVSGLTATAQSEVDAVELNVATVSGLVVTAQSEVDAAELNVATVSGLVVTAQSEVDTAELNMAIISNAVADSTLLDADLQELAAIPVVYAGTITITASNVTHTIVVSNGVIAAYSSVGP